MKRLMILAILAALLGVSCVKSSEPDVSVASEDDKTLYALGLLLGRNLSTLNLTQRELHIVQRGIADQVLGRDPLVDVDTYGPKVKSLAKARGKRAADKEKAKAEAFLEEAAKAPHAVKTASGLIYTELRAGTGPSPKPTDRVKVNYRGMLTDGTEFDSSYDRGPATFPLNRVIKCWTEGVGMMKVGGKARLVCPSDIAYGDRGRPPHIPPGATLVFEVELLGIEGSDTARARGEEQPGETGSRSDD